VEPRTRFAEVLRALIDGRVPGIPALRQADIVRLSDGKLDRSYLSSLLYGNVAQPSPVRRLLLSSILNISDDDLLETLKLPIGSPIALRRKDQQLEGEWRTSPQMSGEVAEILSRLAMVEKGLKRLQEQSTLSQRPVEVKSRATRERWERLHHGAQHDRGTR
jgi:transcriptional regulator with XRE-family HTH domain